MCVVTHQMVKDIRRGDTFFNLYFVIPTDLQYKFTTLNITNNRQYHWKQRVAIAIVTALRYSSMQSFSELFFITFKMVRLQNRWTCPTHTEPMQLSAFLEYFCILEASKTKKNEFFWSMPRCFCYYFAIFESQWKRYCSFQISLLFIQRVGGESCSSPPHHLYFQCIVNNDTIPSLFLPSDFILDRSHFSSYFQIMSVNYNKNAFHSILSPSSFCSFIIILSL